MTSVKNSEYDLPNQDINASPNNDKTKVVFFNATNPLLYPGTGTINIKLNNKHVATLKTRRYVQLYLAPGVYDLYLDHWDMLTWPSEYKFIVDKTDAYIKVFAQMTWTAYEAVRALPEDFEDSYRPAYKNPK